MKKRSSVKVVSLIKHTQGPWHANGQLICNFDNQVLGEVNNFDGCDRGNAHLIAAAPELLEVAKLIVKEWEADISGVEVGALIARLSQYAKEARAAIAKAEGHSK